jgi:hypothetical protein
MRWTAKVRASRGARKTFACGRDGALPDLPLARRRLTFRWTDAGKRTTGDPLGGVWPKCSVPAHRLGQRGRNGSKTPATRASRTPRAERRACSIIPKVLMHTLAEYRIGIRHQGCIGHPAFRTPSSGRVRWKCAKLGRASAARLRTCEFRKSRGCLTFEYGNDALERVNSLPLAGRVPP